MFRPPARAVTLAALLVCLSAAPAAPAGAAELVAQIAQATPDPTAGQPPLTDDPPALREQEPETTPEPAPEPETEPEPDGDSQAQPRRELANTGADAGLLAALGLALLSTGAGLRLTVDGRRRA